MMKTGNRVRYRTVIVLGVCLSCGWGVASALAGNAHDITIDFGDQAVQARSSRNGHGAGTGSMDLHFDHGQGSGGKSIAVDDLQVTSVNRVKGDVTATNGATVSVGDAELADIRANKVRIDTRNTINSNIEVSNGQQFELGTVKVERFRGNSLTVTHSNTLGGNVNVQSGGSVSVGRTHVEENSYNSHGTIGTGSNPGSSIGILDGADKIPSEITPLSVINGIYSNGKKVVEKLGDSVKRKYGGEFINKKQLIRLKEEDLAYAYMAECAYGPERCTPELKNKLKNYGWTVISNDEQLPGSAEFTMFRKKKEGQNDKIAIAFRGTELNKGRKTVADVISDGTSAALIFGPTAEWGDRSSVCAFANELAKIYGAENLTFVGHSKGGGEALWASMATGAQAVVFNPRSEFGSGKLFKNGEARGYFVEHELLSYGRIRDDQLMKIHNDEFFSDGLFDNHSMKTVIHDLEQEIASLTNY